ncbi:hypothetical protein R3F64_15130, partial [Halomonas sp. 5021]|uniref:hypothetical protein n=1 Tax=Halomonas sp. 5021 TaxID=3082156 RepID=UPI002FCA6405
PYLPLLWSPYSGPAQETNSTPNVEEPKKGGCTEVIRWLQKNPPKLRDEVYFGGGLFAHVNEGIHCDLIVIQIDSDILSDESFKNYLGNKGQEVQYYENPEERANETERIIKAFADFNDMTEAEKNKYIPIAAVDAIEAWCIAAFENLDYNPEELQGERLRNAFGAVMSRSNGRHPEEAYAETCKNVSKRKSFCRKHSGSVFLIKQCNQFAKLHHEVVNKNV